MSDLLKGKQIENNSIAKEKLSLVTPTQANDPVTKNYLESQDFINKPTIEGGLIKKATISQLRNLTVTSSDNAITFLSTDIEGTWKPDFSDTTSADNTGTVLVTANNVRLKRLIENDTVHVDWFGTKGDGIVNDAAPLQAALYSGYRNVVFANEYLITTGLVLNSNTTIIGNKATLSVPDGNFLSVLSMYGKDNIEIDGITIKSKTGDAIDFGIIINDSSNITVKNVKILNIGKEASGTGEKGTGIIISSVYNNAPATDSTGSKNVTIENCVIKGTKGFGLVRGDGIYVKTCYKITIKNNLIDKYGRMGIGLTDYVDNVVIDGNTIMNGYLAGIDMEPNSDASVNRNVKIINNTIRNWGNKPSNTIGNQLFGIDIHSRNQSSVFIDNNYFLCENDTAVAAINGMNGVRNIKITNNTIDGGNKLPIGMQLFAGAGVADCQVSGNTIVNFKNTAIGSYKNFPLRITNNHIESSLGVVGITSNESDRIISNNTVILTAANVQYGIGVFQSGITNVNNNIVKVSSGIGIRYRVTSPFLAPSSLITNNQVYNLDVATNSFSVEATANGISDLYFKGNKEIGVFSTPLVSAYTSGLEARVLNESNFERSVLSTDAPSTFKEAITIHRSVGNGFPYLGMLTTFKATEGIWYQILTPRALNNSERAPLIRYSNDADGWGPFMHMGVQSLSGGILRPAFNNGPNHVDYPIGVSVYDARISEGFPIDGVLTTTKNRDGNAVQKLVGTVSGLYKGYVRRNVNLTGWGVFYLEEVSIYYIENSVNIPVLAPGASITLTKSVNNVLAGMMARASMSFDVDGVHLMAWVNGPNSVKVKCINTNDTSTSSKTGTLYIKID